MVLFSIPRSALLVLAGTCAVSTAFVGPSTFHRKSSSSLSVLPPPMIIGPMIKKMQEEKKKKNAPMTDKDEASKEAPGLKVGKRIWKWPAVWPYDQSMFKSMGEAQAMQSEQTMKSLTNMLSGVPQVPEQEVEKEEGSKFDPMKYWGEENVDVTAPLDSDAADKLRAHYEFYLRDDMSVLELGAGEDSYLPSDLKLSRHVGVGACSRQMERNPALTQSMEVDLNTVVPGRDVDSDDLRRLAQEPFDAIIIANTVDYLTNPREVFRSAWYLLKPGGFMMVAFSGKDVTKDQFKDAQTAIWSQYNDDQHMWITGSFFQFSAGDGWESLLGFDISPDSANQADAGPMEKMDNVLNRRKANNIYVVQATKVSQDDSINLENIERSINSLCWMLPVLEDRDKKLVVPRLTRVVETADSDKIKDAIEKNIQHLPTIYKSMSRMDQFAFTFAMQSQMAADLVCDPDFEGSEAQMESLKEGLGLRTPREKFWKPVGENTSAIALEDKISLLAYLVPRFGSDDPAQEDALQAFATGLKPTYAVIRSKCPDLSEADVQLIGTELMANEVAKPGLTTREEFAAWVGMLNESEIRELLTLRKSFREAAKADLVAYNDVREKERKRIEELRTKMQEQIKTAQEERSMYFNPKTEKMEVFKTPKKKE
jgi:SAM-dependent methyltransferase